jgi:hypothetical protein
MSDQWGTPPGQGGWQGQGPQGYQPPPQYGYSPQGVPLPPGGKPPSHLAMAIISTLFCCLPLGIVSIVYASKVDTAWNAGNVAEAVESSDKAKLFWMIALGIAVAGWVAYFLFFGAVLFGTAGLSGGGF